MGPFKHRPAPSSRLEGNGSHYSHSAFNRSHLGALSIIDPCQTNSHHWQGRFGIKHPPRYSLVATPDATMPLGLPCLRKGNSNQSQRSTVTMVPSREVVSTDCGRSFFVCLIGRRTSLIVPHMFVFSTSTSGGQEVQWLIAYYGAIDPSRASRACHSHARTRRRLAAPVLVFVRQVPKEGRAAAAVSALPSPRQESGSRGRLGGELRSKTWGRMSGRGEAGKPRARTRSASRDKMGADSHRHDTPAAPTRGAAVARTVLSKLSGVNEARRCLTERIVASCRMALVRGGGVPESPPTIVSGPCTAEEVPGTNC